MMSWFVAGIMAALAWMTVSTNERDPRRVLAAAFGLVLAVWTRNLLWMLVGLEAFSLAAAPFRARVLAGSMMTLGGVVCVVLSARTTDLAGLPATPIVVVGIGLFAFGVVVKWLGTRDDPFLFLSAGVAVVAIAARTFAWAPGIAGALEPATSFVAVAAVVTAGLGAALSARKRTLAPWLTVTMVGVSILGVVAGTTAMPHVLGHLAASAIMIALVLAGAPPAATWIAMLSLASIPPLPGFVTKLALVARLPSPISTLVIVGLVLSAIGCMKEIERVQPSTGKRWVTWAAGVLVVVGGVWPEPLLGVAARAAAGLF